MNNRKYVIYVNNQAVEVTKEIYKEYWKSIEHERYLTKQIRNTWVYLDHLFDEFESNTLEISLIEDLDPTKNNAIRSEMIEMLYKAIRSLSKEEQELISAIYFDDLTDREYARLTHQKQTTVSWKHRKTLEKLKNLIDF